MARQLTTGIPFTGELATAAGRGIDAIRRLLGEEVAAPVTEPDTAGGRAVGRGVTNILRGGAGAVAVGARAVGAEDAFRNALDFAEATERFATGAFPSERLSFDELMERGTLSDFITFTAENLGEQVPIVASIMLSGGGGALAGQLAARGAVSQAAANQLIGRFALGGTIAGATALETGFTGLEQAAAVGDISPGVALAAGAAKGSLEALVPFAFARRLGLGQAMTGRLGSALERAVARSGLAGFAVGSSVSEGTTEALQEVIDVAARAFVDENFDALGPEAAARIREAAAVGALGGLFFGGGSALVSGRPAAAEFEGGPGPDLNAIQEATARPGQQLEFFLGQDLGIEQPGVSEIAARRANERQFELALEGDLGVAPETIDPRQTDLFDSNPITEVEEPTQPTLFSEMETRLPPQARAILPRGAVELDGDTTINFVRPGEAFIAEADRGVRNTRSFQLDETAGLVNRDAVSGDAFALPEAPLQINDPIVSFVGQELNQGPAIDLALEAQNALVNGDVETAQSRMREAFELGLRIAPTERSGFIIKATDVPGVVETDPTAPNLYGSFNTQDLRNAIQSRLPFSTLLDKPREGDVRQASLNLDALDPQQITAVDMEGTVVDAIRATKAGNIDRALGMAARSGVELSGERAEQVRTLRELASVSRDTRPVKFIELFEKGRIRQTLTDLSTVYIKGRVPNDAIVETDNVRQRSAVLNYEPNNTQAYNSAFTGEKMSGGSRYDPAKHAPATAVILGKGSPTLEAIRRDYTRLLKAIGSKAKIIINMKTEGPYILGPKQRGAYYLNGDIDGTYVIALKASLDEKSMTVTAMHEFGHFIMGTELRKAGAAKQQMLLNAFRRSLLQGARDGGRFAFLRAANPERAKRDLPLVEEGEARAGVSPEQFSTTDAFASLGLDKWYDFDEWFAEQSVRWMTTSQKPLSVVDEVFRTVGLQLRKVFRAFMQRLGVKRRPVREMSAAPEIQSFLDSLIERRGEQRPIGEAARQDAVRGERADAKVVLDPVESPAAPGTAETYLADRGADEMLPNMTAQEKKRLKAQADRYTMFTKWGWTILQLADMNQHIRGLQRYVEFMNRWYVMKMRWIVRADTRVKEWNALGAEQSDRLGRFLFEIAEMKYLAQGEAARWPTPAEIAALVQKHKLSNDAFDVYTNIQSDFNDVLVQLELTLKKEATKAFTADPAALQRELTLIDQEMVALRGRPYFPFSRFGDWTIVVRSPKDGSVIYMEQFESRLQQKRALERVKKAYPTGLIRLDKMPSEVEIMRGLPPTVLRSMASKLKLSQEQREWLDALIFDAAPSQSFRQRFRQRRGTAGFSYDAIRSYANYFFHGANHLARIEYEGDLRDSIQAVQQEAQTLAKVPDVDITKRRQIIDFMNHHLGYLLTPINDWAALRSLAFTYHLGFSPASAFINFTQVPMVAAPYLAAQYSDGAALRELSKAIKDIQRIYKGKPGSVPTDELRAVELGIEQGFLDESQATELAAVSEGHVLQRTLPGNQALRAIRHAGYWAGWMFQNAERLNRRVVFRAAYRLAKDRPNAAYLTALREQHRLQISDLLADGWAETEAVAFVAGKDAIRKTQFDYARHGRPRFMQGKKGVAFTFFMFTQQQLWFARHTPGRARYLLLLLVSAGLMGMPGAEDLNNFIKFVTRFGERFGFGKKVDLEKEAREFFSDVVEVNPDLILHGISQNSFGMTSVGDALGIPIPSVDLSGRLGMGQVLPGMEALGSEGAFEERVGRGAIDAAGAAFNIPINFLKALSDNHPDWFKRWERTMPTAFRNLSKAARFLRDQEERTRTGAQVVAFDINDPQALAEIAAVAAGFAPKRLTKAWDQIIMREEALQYWTTKRGMLLRQYHWAAFVQKNREGKADALKAIRLFNREVPENAMKITGQNLIDSMRQREKARALQEKGLPTTRRDIPLAREINRLFDEPSSVVKPEDLEEGDIMIEDAPGAVRR